MLLPRQGVGATNYVYSLGDSGPGSLRGAIEQALPDDTIVFEVQGTILLSSGPLLLQTNLHIIGPTCGTLVAINGSNNSPIFIIVSNATVDISNLILTNAANGIFGSPPEGGAIRNLGNLTLTRMLITDSAAMGGGGIYNAGTLAMSEVIVQRNRALNAGGLLNLGELSMRRCTISSNLATEIEVLPRGGGMMNLGVCTMDQTTIIGNSTFVPQIQGGVGGGVDNFGTLIVTRSAVIGNSANIGGGIVNENGVLAITNSTFGNNFGRTAGGAIWAGTNTILDSCTISANSGGEAAGIRAFPGIQVKNCIIGRNTSLNGGDCSGTLESLGYNLIQNTNSCTITGVSTGNIFGRDPLLGPLANNGGPTLTFALLSGSPAVDAGSPVGFPLTDQRGFPRPVDGNGDGVAIADIGAYEKHSPQPMTLPVTSLVDGDAGSLRQVLSTAEKGDTIVFDVSGTTTSVLCPGPIQISKCVQIVGSGAQNLVFDGKNSAGPMFVINAGATVGISDLTISNFVNPTVPGSGQVSGGGIQNFGNLSMTRCIVTRCAAEFGYGGGILSFGPLSLFQCSISNNAAEQGGAGIATTGPLLVNASVVSGNRAFFDNGGGILIRGAIAKLTNSTISGNSVYNANGGGISTDSYTVFESCTVASNSVQGIFSITGKGGGLFLGSAYAEARNTVFGGNTAVTTGVPPFTLSIGPDIFGLLFSQGWNLIQNPTNATIAGVLTGNLLGVDPRLGPLQDNGGPTFTHALLSGSPAIDAGSPSTFPPADQRGVARPQDGNGDGIARADIGAYEKEGVIPGEIPGNLIVTSLNDSGPGTLRSAIAQARSGDKITFAIQGMLLLSNGPIILDKNITIAGPGSSNLVIDPRFTPTSVSSNTGPVFVVAPTVVVTIEDVTIQNAGSSLLDGSRGGAVFNRGNLAMVRVVISGCQATYGGAISSTGDLSLRQCFLVYDTGGSGGGGIESSSGRLTVDSCTLAYLRSGLNGGGILKSSGNAQLINSTIAKSYAEGGNGGGIYLGQSYFNINSCTIVENHAATNGGGIYIGAGGAAEVRNSILALNGAKAGPDCFGTLYSQGWNLIQNPTNASIAGILTGNITGADPLLGPLQNNGGPTPTYALLDGSPAINRANPYNFPPTDQRGFPRPMDGTGDSRLLPDIGAYEKEGFFRPRVQCTSLAGGTVQLSAVGMPGQSYVIQATESLSEPKWVTVADIVVCTNAVFELLDTKATANARFYRIGPAQ